MKYIGFLILFSAAFAAVRSYSENERNKLMECRGFLELFRYMRLRMSCFMSSPAEAASGFSSDALLRIGFLSKLSECKSMLLSYRYSEDKLSLDPSERKVIEKYLESSGSGYLDDELRLIDEAIGSLTASESSLSSEVPKRVRVASILLACSAAGVFILMI